MAKRVRVDAEFARYALSGIEAAIEKMQRQAAELRNIVTASAAGVRAAVGARRGRPPGSASGAGDSRGALTFSPLNDPLDVTKVNADATPRGTRTMSPEARRRISEAQKARWAKQKDQAGTKSRKRGLNTSGANGARGSKKR